MDEHGRQVLSERIERSLGRFDEPTLGALLEHPEALDAALDAAVRRVLDVDANRAPERLGSGPIRTLSDEESRARVSARTVSRAEDEEYLGVNEVVELLGLGSRQAVHGRRERGRLIGFVNGRRDVLFPRAQFDERGRVPPGLAEVLELFGGDGWEAWAWLSTPSAALDDGRPLERLRAGDLELVLAAARGHLQGDFG